MINKRYSVTSLTRCGTYRIAQQDRECPRTDVGVSAWTTEQMVFTSTCGDAIRLIKDAAGTHTLWEMTGFHLQRAALPLLDLLASCKIPSCPIAVSDTRLAFLLPNDTSAAVVAQIRRMAMEKMVECVSDV